MNINDHAAIIERLGRPSLGWTVTKVTKTQVTLSKTNEDGHQYRDRRFSLKTRCELGTPHSWPAKLFEGDYAFFAARVEEKLAEDRAVSHINAVMRTVGNLDSIRHIEDAASRLAKLQAAADEIRAIVERVQA